MSNAITPSPPAGHQQDGRRPGEVRIEYRFTITITDDGPGVANTVTSVASCRSAPGSWASGRQTHCARSPAPPAETLTCASATWPMTPARRCTSRAPRRPTLQGDAIAATAQADNFVPITATASTTVLCPGLSIQKSTSTPVISRGRDGDVTITVSKPARESRQGVQSLIPCRRA